MKKVYVCKDSLEGIFTGIYYAWNTRHEQERDKITVLGEDTMELFSEYIDIPVDINKASVVLRTIQNRLGAAGYEDIFSAAMSWESRKADAILGTVIEATRLRNSKSIMSHLSNEHVRTVFELSRNVTNESHHYKMFVRFRELENGILFSEIEPKSNILPLISDHFADRFPLEDWVIYDHRRKEFLLHRKQEGCFTVSDEELNMEEISRYSKEERHLEDLWKQFLESISIKERENKQLQRQNMPLRFRNHMVDFD